MPAPQPSGPVIGYQRWDQLAFLHWVVPQEVLRPLIHPRLSLDTWEGQAYVSVVPFTLVGGRIRGLPPLPGASTFLELNVRTYVTLEGKDPGVWFFSLDAASALAVAGARASIGLPYFWARMQRSVRGATHRYECTRKLPAKPRATFSASWAVEGAAGTPTEPGSLDEFLCERYALYSSHLGMLVRGDVVHPRWVLRPARLLRLEQDLCQADGLAALEGEPIFQYSDGVDVEFLPPRVV